MIYRHGIDSIYCKKQDFKLLQEAGFQASLQKVKCQFDGHHEVTDTGVFIVERQSMQTRER